MNKRSYIRRNRFKERNIKNEVIRIDNARINKLIENKKNSAKSIKCYIRMLVSIHSTICMPILCTRDLQGFDYRSNISFSIRRFFLLYQ